MPVSQLAFCSSTQARRSRSRLTARRRRLPRPAPFRTALRCAYCACENSRGRPRRRSSRVDWSRESGIRCRPDIAPSARVDFEAQAGPRAERLTPIEYPPAGCGIGGALASDQLGSISNWDTTVRSQGLLKSPACCGRQNVCRTTSPQKLMRRLSE
jgi:hypothetical protein